MGAVRIDGKALAERFAAQTGARAVAHTDASGRAPRLEAVLVGDDPASAVYVRAKRQAARAVGIDTGLTRLAADAPMGRVVETLDEMNGRPDVDGILLQLPLPSHLDKAALLDRLDPDKDVDCFHPRNVGLALIGRAPMPPPTPQAVIEILDSRAFDLAGAEVVIVNHSMLVGKPLAALMINRDATVAICHKRTRDLERHTRRADVVVSGTGVAGLITARHVRAGAFVIDVGFARTTDGRLTGDVRQAEVAEVASAYTPVPGGVGPVTIAMLLRNTVTAAERQANGEKPSA